MALSEQTLLAALQTVIANRVGRLNCRLHIAGLNELKFLLTVMGPHTRQIIGLQFEPHRPFVVFRFR